MLVRFEIPSLTAGAASSRAGIDQAQARVENAKAAASRVAGLFDRGVAARKEVEDADRELREAQAALAQLTRWPVTISYFDRSIQQDAGEQTPTYAITFELYENGISRALLLDYGDFVIKGEMTSLEIKDVKPCK